MTTITIKNTTPIWKKKNFSDDGDLLDYLLENYQVGKLSLLPKEEVTHKMKKECEEVSNMNDDEFIDIR